MVVRTHVESQRGENQTWEARWWSSISSCPFITRRKPKEWNVDRTIHHQNQTWLLSVWTSDRKCGKKKDFWRAAPKLSGVKRCIHFLWPFPSLMPPTCVVASRIRWSTLLLEGWTRDSQHTRGSWFSYYTCKRHPDRVSGRTLRWFC